MVEVRGEGRKSTPGLEEYEGGGGHSILVC